MPEPQRSRSHLHVGPRARLPGSCLHRCSCVVVVKNQPCLQETAVPFSRLTGLLSYRCPLHVVAHNTQPSGLHVAPTAPWRIREHSTKRNGYKQNRVSLNMSLESSRQQTRFLAAALSTTAGPDQPAATGTKIQQELRKESAPQP